MEKFNARRPGTVNCADFLAKIAAPSETVQLVKYTSAMPEVHRGDPTKLRLYAGGDYKKLEQHFVSQDLSKFMASVLLASLGPFEFRVQNANLVHVEPFNLVMVQQNAARVRVE